MVDLANGTRAVVNREGRYYRVVSTGDATETTIWSMELKADTALMIEARVAGFYAAGNQAAGFWYAVTVARSGVAAARIVGGPNLVVTPMADDFLWSSTFRVNVTANGTVDLTVTGAAGDSISWNAAVHVLEAPWA